MVSGPGDSILRGSSRLFTADKIPIAATGSLQGLTVNVGTPGATPDFIFMALSPAQGQSLAVGTYENARRFPDVAHPGIDISGNGSGCNQTAGRFEVKDVALDSKGAVQRLWITYEQDCGGGTPALQGEIRMGEPARTSALVVPSSLRWAPDDFGRPGVVLPAYVLAAKDFRVGRVAIDGPNATDFTIQDQGCAGRPLARGDFCAINMLGQPSYPGTRSATLRVTDANRGGDALAPASLTAFSFGGRTRLVMHSDPGDYIGKGLDWSYTAKTASFRVFVVPRGIEFTVFGDNGDEFTGTFSAGGGALPAVGQTYSAVRIGLHGEPTMDVDGNGSGCNELDGTFTVTDLALDPNGFVTSFAVDFEQHCEHVTPALHGSFEFREGDITQPAPWFSL
jgi:hypothetical protein